MTPIIQRLEDNKVSVFVAPRFIKENNHLYNVDNEFNGVIVEGKFSGRTIYKEEGQVLIQLERLYYQIALSHGYKYEFKSMSKNMSRLLLMM